MWLYVGVLNLYVFTYLFIYKGQRDIATPTGLSSEVGGFCQVAQSQTLESFRGLTESARRQGYQ